jgi:hypothetical protein
MPQDASGRNRPLALIRQSSGPEEKFEGHLKKGHCGEDFSVIYAQHLALLLASFPI